MKLRISPPSRRFSTYLKGTYSNGLLPFLAFTVTFENMKSSMLVGTTCHAQVGIPKFEYVWARLKTSLQHSFQQI